MDFWGDELENQFDPHFAEIMSLSVSLQREFGSDREFHGDEFYGSSSEMPTDSGHNRRASDGGSSSESASENENTDDGVDSELEGGSDRTSGAENHSSGEEEEIFHEPRRRTRTTSWVDEGDDLLDEDDGFNESGDESEDQESGREFVLTRSFGFPGGGPGTQIQIQNARRLDQLALERIFVGRGGADGAATSKLKFNPESELDAPISHASLKKSKNEDKRKWMHTMKDSLRSLRSADCSPCESEECAHVVADWFYDKGFCLLKKESFFLATIIRAKDGTRGCAFPLDKCSWAPLLIVHLARSQGHEIHHVKYSGAHTSFDTNSEIIHLPGLESPNSYESFELTKDLIPNTEAGHFSCKDSESLAELGVQCIVKLGGTGGIYTYQVGQETAFICEFVRDVYIVCSDSIRAKVVDFLCTDGGSVYPKYYLGKAQSLLGFDIKLLFGEIYLGADSLVNVSTLLFPLKESFRFGKPKAPMEPSSYKEMMTAGLEGGLLSLAPVSNVNSLLGLMRFLSQTVRPDLTFFHDSVLWNSIYREGDWIESSFSIDNFEPFKDCLLYLMHTAESSLRFCAPPTPMLNWSLDCYLDFELLSQPCCDVASYAVFLNKEPFCWDKFIFLRTSETAHSSSEFPESKKARFVSNPPGIEEVVKNLLETLSGSDSGPIAAQALVGSPVPITFKTHDKQLLSCCEKLATQFFAKNALKFEIASKEENRAVFLARPSFNDEFTKRVVGYGLV